MKIWFDTEFVEDGKTIDLMSIGCHREDGARYYAEPAECDLSRASDWVKQNVIPHLSGRKTPRFTIAKELIEFAGDKPEFWAYYADYDWVALCQLFGTMMELPTGWPMYCRDLKQLCDERGNPILPPQTSVKHNALSDAVWAWQAWHFLQTKPEGRPAGEEQVRSSEAVSQSTTPAPVDTAKGGEPKEEKLTVETVEVIEALRVMVRDPNLSVEYSPILIVAARLLSHRAAAGREWVTETALREAENQMAYCRPIVAESHHFSIADYDRVLGLARSALKKGQS